MSSAVQEVAGMQDVELFVHMAEIAGVFVGFGALIAVRSGATVDVNEISSLRWVLSGAVWAVFAALVPIFVSRFGVVGRDLWFACSLLAVVFLAIVLAVNSMPSEIQQDRAETVATRSPVWIVLVMGSTFWLPVIALVLALVLVVLGVAPAQDEALYLAAVGLGLFTAALSLFGLVFWQRRATQPGDG
jgi:hypothetical protein